MKKLAVLALIVMFSAFSFSQSIDVTFQVDMSGQIFVGNFPASANVVVRGSFQTDAGDPGGNWQGNLFLLIDPDDDSIYTGTCPISSNFVGNSYSFKYVIVNPPANDNWESTPGRQFTLTSPSTIIPLDCFNQFCGEEPLIEVSNTLEFTADISGILGLGVGGAFDPNQDSLLVMGLDWGDSSVVIGNRKMENTDPFNAGIYTTTLTIQTTYDSLRWKFKASPNSRFQREGWEFGPDRWYVNNPNDSLIVLPTIISRIRPLFPILQTDVDLKIYVDMSYASNRYNGLTIPINELEFVGIRGSEDFLGSYWGGCWCENDTATGFMKVLTPCDFGNFWLYHTILPAGTSTGLFEYKFAAMYPDADTIHGGNSPLDNELPFDAYHLFALTESPTNLVLMVYFGNFEPHSVERFADLIPSNFQLEQNYPNPFNPTTVIRYSIPEYSFVSLKVFNLLGQEVETLVNTDQPTGVYEATFDASGITSGIYFYTLKTKNFTSTKKMILIR